MDDLTTLTDEVLDQRRIDVLTEQENRATLANAPAQAEALAVRYAAASGRKDGDDWTQPTGAHDAYPTGATATRGGKTWEATTGANVWEPGTSGWREVVAEGGAPPAWVQPTGAHDAYAIGNQVTFKGGTYESLIEANTYSPADYPAGWKVL